MNPDLAVRERAKRRNQNREDELFKEKVSGVEDIWAAEVHYEVEFLLLGIIMDNYRMLNTSIPFWSFYVSSSFAIIK